MAKETIRAIVLSCDRYQPFAEHMVWMYQKLWPDHPFSFRIPYQNLYPLLTALPSNRVEARQTPASIRATVLALLADLDDDEMVYWCLDDKYPLWLHRTRIQHILAWLSTSHAEPIDGILFCRCRRMWESTYLTGASIHDERGNRYFERINYEQIWIHQFIKVKVLRHLFTAMPSEIAHANEMDALKYQINKPTEHRIYVSQYPYGRFGESTHRGKITANCLANMNKIGFTLPASAAHGTAREILMGSARDELFFDAQRLRIQPFIQTLAAKLVR